MEQKKGVKSYKKSDKVGRKVGRKKDYKTAGWLRESSEQYFTRCDRRLRIKYSDDGVPFEVDNPAPYTVEGLCVFLGISVATWWRWLRDETDFGECARVIHTRIADNRITGALDGTQTASFARFMMCNNHKVDYQDKVVMEGQVSVEKGLLDLLRGVRANEL